MILGLIGKKHCGKDSFYCACLELYVERRIISVPYRLAFADAVKKELCKNLNISTEELNTHKEKYRLQMQELGATQRAKDPDYWIKQIRAPKGWAKDGFIIFTDCRFLNEAEFIRKLGGKLIRIRRDVSDKTEDKHISETELEKIVYHNIIHNNTTLLRYKMEVLDILRQYDIP